MEDDKKMTIKEFEEFLRKHSYEVFIHNDGKGTLSFQGMYKVK